MIYNIYPGLRLQTQPCPGLISCRPYRTQITHSTLLEPRAQSLGCLKNHKRALHPHFNADHGAAAVKDHLGNDIETARGSQRVPNPMVAFGNKIAVPEFEGCNMVETLGFLVAFGHRQL